MYVVPGCMVLHVKSDCSSEYTASPTLATMIKRNTNVAVTHNLPTRVECSPTCCNNVSRRCQPIVRR